jgi:hypothetical protein
MKLVFPGGTDVAEMALFSVDAPPADRNADADSLRRMEAEGSITRFDTDADGGYLLHAYVDEPIPEDIVEYCDTTDPKTGRLDLRDARIGFGGAESLFRSFNPNSKLRTDATAARGENVLRVFYDFAWELPDRGGRVDDAAEREKARLEA